MISQILLILQNSLIKLCLPKHQLQLMQVLGISKNLHAYKWSNTDMWVCNSATGKQTSQAPFPLPALHPLPSPHTCRSPWQQQALSSCPGSESWAVPSPLGIPWVPEVQQESLPWLRVQLCQRQHLLLTNQTALCLHWLPRLNPRSLASL